MCCELVSPVLDYTPSTLSEIEAIWQSFESISQTNASCGLHIHLDAEDLSLEDIVRVAANYAYFEPVIDLFMSADRRGDRNPYIASVRRAVSRPSHWDLLRRVLDGEASHLSPRSLSVLDAINPKPRKKHKLNLTNSFYHGLHQHGMGGKGQKETAYINTIENRHHNATLRYDEVARWIRFNLCFVHIAKTTVFVEEEERDENNEKLLDIDGNEPAEIWRRFKVLADLMADDEMMGHYEEKLDEALMLKL